MSIYGIKIKQFKIDIDGAGEQEKLRKNLISYENIEFFSSQNDIYPYYFLIDCFVSTLNFKPFGLVILEVIMKKYTYLKFFLNFT